MSTATNASPVRTARPIVTLSPSLCLTQRCCYTRPHSATRADGRTANVKVRSPPSPSFRRNGSPNDDRRPSDSLLLRAAAWLHARRHRERERRTGKGRGPQNQAPCVCGRELNRFGRFKVLNATSTRAHNRYRESSHIRHELSNMAYNDRMQCQAAIP